LTPRTASKPSIASKTTPQEKTPNNAFFQIGSDLEEGDDAFDLRPVSLTLSGEFISSRVQIPVSGCFEMFYALVKIVRWAADEIFVLESFDVMGLDGNDVVDMLKAAGDEEKRFLSDNETKLLE